MRVERRLCSNVAAGARKYLRKAAGASLPARAPDIAHWWGAIHIRRRRLRVGSEYPFGVVPLERPSRSYAYLHTNIWYFYLQRPRSSSCEDVRLLGFLPICK